MKLGDYYDSFLDYLIKCGRSKETVRHYKDFYRLILSRTPLVNKEVKDLRLVDVADLLAEAEKHGKYGPQRSISQFRTFLKFLEESRVEIPFYWDQISLPKAPESEQDFLTEEEFIDFVEKIPTNTFYGLRNRALYEFLWSTGCRIGEALAVQRSDVDFEKKEVKIRNSKGGDEEKVYLSDRCIFWLQKYLSARTDNHPALWVAVLVAVRPLSHSQAKRILEEYRVKFGIKKRITHHSFRRGFCSFLLQKGATIKEVQYLARHKSERTTLRLYCKVEKQRVKEVHDLIFNHCQDSLNSLTR